MASNQQAEMEQCIGDFIQNINDTQSDTILGMIKPKFVSCDCKEQTLLMSFPAMAWERNPLGVMQGGIVATILDFAIACLSIYFGGDAPVTVSLQTSYLRAMPIDGTVMVRVQATKAGRTMIHAFAEAWDEKAPGKLIATSIGVYKA